MDGMGRQIANIGRIFCVNTAPALKAGGFPIDLHSKLLILMVQAMETVLYWSPTCIRSLILTCDVRHKVIVRDVALHRFACEKMDSLTH